MQMRKDPRGYRIIGRASKEKRELIGNLFRKHGMVRTPEYTAYQNAKNRCNRPADVRYKHYGGRGIEFRFTSFQEFYDHIGPRPDGHTLDRIDNDGHYEVGNVRWATPEENARNGRTYRVH